MRSFLGLAAAAMALATFGCKDLKDQQRSDIVGNSETKLYYKNVKSMADAIPKDKRVFFGSQDEATAAGYTNSQEGGAAKEPGSGDQ